jgi:hypothetical protein
VSGGIDVSSRPSGTASPAMMKVAIMTSAGRTRKLMSAPRLSLSPKKISPGSPSWIVTRNWVTSTTSASISGPNGEILMRFGSRPHRMPTPIPRKLAISRKFRKKPT